MSRVHLTTARLSAFQCPTGRSQAFLWDDRAPGLALRVTANGARAYVFQGRLLGGRSFRITIGEPVDSGQRGTWTLPAARAEARRLQSLVDQGRDPRRERAAQIAQDEAARASQRQARRLEQTTGLMAWATYCAERQRAWSPRNHADHLAYAAAGGRPRLRGKGVTEPGPLHRLLDRPLVAIDARAVQDWLARETDTRPTRAALGFRLLRAFLNWCAETEAYGSIVQPQACSGRRTRELMMTPRVRKDALQREQLRAWFTAVQADSNTIAAAYLQVLLLTGARREELARVQWTDLDFEWKSRRIGDKIEGARVIPMTPYTARLLAALPRVPGNPHVFASRTARGGHLREPRSVHVRALARAGLPMVTVHGLRRSFGTLAEWVDVPVGIVAQIQGHKPSAIAEKHYRVRPIDLLRLWHARIEAWILREAGIAPATAI